MEVTKRNTEVSLSILWKVLRKWFWIPLLVGVVGILAAALYFFGTYTPKYEATAELYVLRDVTNDDNGYVVADMVVEDCKAILHKRVVLERVIQKLGYEETMAWGELERMMKTSLDEKTHFISVTVTADSPKQAQLLADTICEEGKAAINEVIGEQHARYVLKSEANDTVSNYPSFLIIGLIGLAMMLVTYVVLVFVFIRQDYIGSNEELEKQLGVVILGDIPDANKTRRRNKYYYYRYSGYGTNRDADGAKGDKK